ncbi:MAG TPA: LamG domain-containing protein [Phycisphaerales bacterium]|nr:LamG domain-containing protein [Phycisphaerales bacterium]
MPESLPPLAMLAACICAAAGLTTSAFQSHAQTATLITHGWQFNASQFPEWTIDLAGEVALRAGDARVYRYRPATNDWLLLSTTGAGSPTHIVLVADWIAECGGADNPQRGYAEGAADALYAAFADPRGDLAGVTLTDRAIHLIGHSRGAVVNSELAERFAARDIPVDQVTHLDPHPVNGTFAEPFTINWFDPNPQVWAGVTWADNYYRTDSDPFDFNGMPVPGTHLPTPMLTDAMFPGANTYAHLDVHLWYHGTVNPTSPIVCDSSACISATNMPTWYPLGRSAEGYRYSALAGGQSLRTSAGVSPRVAPLFPSVVFNGGFDQGSMAGWHYHGGGGGATAVTQGSGHALRLNPGSERTHNAFVAPLVPSVVQFQAARPAAAGNTLIVSLSSAGIPTHTFPAIDANTLPVSPAMQPFLPIPEQFRGRACTLRVQHTAGAGTGHILVDSIAVTTCRDDTVTFWAFDQGMSETCGRAALDGTAAGGAVVLQSAPRLGSLSSFALRLAGAPARVNIPAQLSTNPLPTGTLEAWVMLEGPDPALAGGVIFNYGAPSAHTDLQASILPPLTPGDPLRSMLWINSGGAAPVDMPGLTMNSWHHIAWTWDGSMHEFYVDGVLANAAASPHAPLFTGTSAQIGSDDDGSSPFTGRLADVRLCNRVLTPTELANGAFAGLGGGCDPIDFNRDGLFPDTADIDDFLSVFSGGPCSTGSCGDIDFNNDGLFPDTLDIDSLLSVFSGGDCL